MIFMEDCSKQPILSCELRKSIKELCSSIYYFGFLTKFLLNLFCICLQVNYSVGCIYFCTYCKHLGSSWRYHLPHYSVALVYRPMTHMGNYRLKMFLWRNYWPSGSSRINLWPNFCKYHIHNYIRMLSLIVKV